MSTQFSREIYSLSYISYLSNSRVHKPQTHNSTGKLLTSLSVLPSHMTQLWAPIEQVQPSFREFLPVSQEPQHSMAEILNRCKYSHPFSAYLVLETVQKKVDLQPLPTQSNLYKKRNLKTIKFENRKELSKADSSMIWPHTVSRFNSTVL